MPYLPPEGFSPYPGSHLYYREEQGADPKTGGPCRWITYFDPNAGTYHQVAYPLTEPEPPPTPTPAPKSSAQAPPQAQPQPQAQQPQSQPQPQAQQPQSPQPPPRKRKKGPIIALVLLLAVAISVLVLWRTGAYQKLPFLDSAASPFQSQKDPPSTSEPGQPPELPDRGTAQRDAIAALYPLLLPTGDAPYFMGLGELELKTAAAAYSNRVSEEIRQGVETHQRTLSDLAGEDDLSYMIYGLHACAAATQVEARLVEGDEERAVVELTAHGRVDLDKVSQWLLDMDYGAPFDDYLRKNHNLSRDSLVTGYFETGWPRYFAAYWGEALKVDGGEDIRTDEPYTLEVTLERIEGEGWILESVPEELTNLLFAHAEQPMDLTAPAAQAMAALGGAAEPTPSPTNGPSAGSVQSGEYIFETPGIGQTVLLILYPDYTFYLETFLGGDGYYAQGDYQVMGTQLSLLPEGDYYKELMGDLSTALFDIGIDGTLTLLAPGNVGLMEQGQVLSLAAAAPAGDILAAEELFALLDLAMTDEYQDYLEQYPSLSAFPSGLYIREDGYAAFMLDGSPGKETFDYFLGSLPGPHSGSKALGYVSPGNDHGSMNIATVYGDMADDGYCRLQFDLKSDGTIQVSSFWEEEEYIAYEPPDGIYSLYQ